MNQNISNILLAGIGLLLGTTSWTQNAAVQYEQDNLIREYQLLNKAAHKNSLTIRPFMGRKEGDSLSKDSVFTWYDPRKLKQDFMPDELYAYPLRLETQFNSKRPFGWGNGSFIQARGAQFRFSTGLLYKSEVLEVGVQPEFIMADNAPYKITSAFGDTLRNNYHKLFFGNSYARLNFGPLTAGFSNENIWWGPGQFGALILSNNAPGFGHLHLSTRRPIRNPIMDIEFQFIAAGLDQDSSHNAEIAYLKSAPYVRQWRYMNGFAIVLQPKPIPGLYLGLTRAMQFYRWQLSLMPDNISFLEKYLPAVTAFFGKFNPQTGDNNFNDGRDQQASVFLRFVMPKEHFEVYFEYGYNDYKDNLRDLTIDAQHSAAYIVGTKKMIPLAKKNTYLGVSLEAIQMAQSADFITRNAGNWYLHGQMTQGFTHMNQILGVGSGVGNNFQTLQVERVQGLNRVGLRFQKIQNDPRRIVGDINNGFLGTTRWNDAVVGAFGQYRMGKLAIKGECLYVHSTNYGWAKGTSMHNIFGSLNFLYTW
jgi:Capsule assembly protein Wzi